MKSDGGLVLGLLGVLFVGLKLTHQIDWSWWWVTLPFWIGIAIVFALLFAILFGILMSEILRKSQRRRSFGTLRK